MPGTLTVQLNQEGAIMLPKRLLDSYNLQPGDTITILDLGGVLMLRPRRSKTDAASVDVAQALADSGETLESMLAALRDERERRAGES